YESTGVTEGISNHTGNHLQHAVPDLSPTYCIMQLLHKIVLLKCRFSDRYEGRIY
ncbi:Uncharacterized protein DAT39_002171, partial [Clarias magur]